MEELPSPPSPPLLLLRFSREELELAKSARVRKDDNISALEKRKKKEFKHGNVTVASCFELP